MHLKTIKIDKHFKDLEKAEELALNAFPIEEYISASDLIKMSEHNLLDFWALYDHDRFVGYMAVKKYKQLAYLFFLAIMPSERSKGYGASAIESLKSLYPDREQVVDFEMLDAHAENAGQREKRRSFYLKNGYKETGHFLSYFGVDYEIFSMNDNFDINLFKEMMKNTMVKDFKPIYFTKDDLKR